MQGPINTMTWEALTARVGIEIGASEWILITQPMIDSFADVTGDHYFLHIDPQRAAALRRNRRDRKRDQARAGGRVADSDNHVSTGAPRSRRRCHPQIFRPRPAQ